MSTQFPRCASPRGCRSTAAFQADARRVRVFSCRKHLASVIEDLAEDRGVPEVTVTVLYLGSGSEEER